MTDEEYRAFLTVLYKTHVLPRLPRVRRGFHHHMMEEWHYHLDQVARSARLLRYIDNYCDDGGDVYSTFTPDRLASAVRDTRSGLSFANRVVEEAGFMDVYERHTIEILSGLQPQHIPEVDKDVLRDMGSPDPEAELAEMVYRSKANRERFMRMCNEVSFRQQLENAEEKIAVAQKEFDEIKKMETKKDEKEHPKKSRRWFKGLGQISQGAALSIANVALAAGVINFPVSPETQTWGTIASVATGIGTVLSGVGDLRNE